MFLCQAIMKINADIMNVLVFYWTGMDLSCILLILNMIIYNSFISPNHFLSVHIQEPVSFTMPSNSVT